MLFSLAVSYFWLSDTCQDCSDLVSDSSGEMVKSCFQQRGEQGNSWKHVCAVWSDQSLPKRVTVSKRHVPRHAAEIWVTQWNLKSLQVPPKSAPINHSLSSLNSQEPELEFGLVPGAPGLCSDSHWTQGAELHFGSQQENYIGSSWWLVLPCWTP